MKDEDQERRLRSVDLDGQGAVIRVASRERHERGLCGRSRGAKRTRNCNSTSFPLLRVPTRMKPLTQYGLMAEKHWREFLPRMVEELESKRQLPVMLLEAEEKTEAEMDRVRRDLISQGLTPEQAHGQAWEMVRERYIFLPPET